LDLHHQETTEAKIVRISTRGARDRFPSEADLGFCLWGHYSVLQHTQVMPSMSFLGALGAFGGTPTGNFD